MKRSFVFELAVLVLTISVAVVATAGATSSSRTGGIAFRRYLDSQQSWGAIFTVRPDGTGTRQLTHPPRGTVDDQPSWSPDGKHISFTRCAAGALCHVYVMAPDGTSLAPVGPLCPAGADERSCSDDANASFSPDSKHIAITQSTGDVRNDPRTEDWIEHSALVVMNLDGSGRRVIYQGPAFSGDLNFPVYSPDGRRLVFERHVSGFAKPAGRLAVYVIGADGAGLRRLTSWAENAGDNPDWSPDGKWILFHSHVDESSPQSQYFLIHPDGTGHRQITHFRPGTHVASASFSPDSKSIVFSKGPEGGNVDVFTMRLDGSGVRRLTRSPLWDSAADWGFGS